MTRVFTAALVLSLTSGAALACPWAGGTYYAKDQNFRTDFTVNADCTEIVFESSGSAGFQSANTPATVPLVQVGETWVGEGGQVKLTLLEDGKWIEFDAPGVVNKRMRTAQE